MVRISSEFCCTCMERVDSFCSIESVFCLEFVVDCSAAVCVCKSTMLDSVSDKRFSTADISCSAESSAWICCIARFCCQITILKVRIMIRNKQFFNMLKFLILTRPYLLIIDAGADFCYIGKLLKIL